MVRHRRQNITIYTKIGVVLIATAVIGVTVINSFSEMISTSVWQMLSLAGIVLVVYDQLPRIKKYYGKKR